MKLARKEALRLHNAISALDGYDRVIRKNNEDQVVRGHYKFSSDVLLTLAINGNVLLPVAEAYGRARQKVTMAHADENGDVKGKDSVAAVEAAIETLLDEELELDLKPIKAPDLKLDENQIPQSVVGALTMLFEKPAE